MFVWLKKYAKNYFSTVLLSLICITESYVTVMNCVSMLLMTQQLAYNFVHCGAKFEQGSFANCLQKIDISPQVMFANIWHYI